MSRDRPKIDDVQRAVLALARRHGLEAKPIRAMLGQTDPSPRTDDAALLWRSEGTVHANEFQWCLQFLLEHCEPPVVMDALKGDDLRAICNRLMFMNYIMDPLGLHYTKDELAVLLSGYSEHLRSNWEPLIATGYPSVRFGTSLWLDWNLTDIYRTKLPGYVTKRQRRDGHLECTYRWVAERLDHPVPHHLFLGPPYALNIRPYGTSTTGWRTDSTDLTTTSYADAPPMGGLSIDHAYMMERVRPAMLSVKVSLLKAAEAALIHNDDTMLRDQSVTTLQKKFSKPEIGFLFGMDDPSFIRCYGKSAGPVCGGLTCLLNVLGVIESEMRIGIASSTMEALGELFVRRKGGQACVRSAGVWFSPAELRQMDGAMVICAELLMEYESFQAQYSDEVTRQLSDTLLDQVSVSVRVSPERSPEIQALFNEFASRVDGLLQPKGANGETPTPREDDPPQGDSPHLLFRGDFWEVFFEGRKAQLKDSKGIRYLAILLRHPRTSIIPSDLVRMLNKPTPEALRMADRGDAFENPISADSRQFAMDDTTEKCLKNRIAELDGVIADASEKRDAERSRIAHEERTKLKAHLKNNSYKGMHKQIGSFYERDRKSVGNAIRRTVKKVKDANGSIALPTRRKGGHHECCSRLS